MNERGGGGDANGIAGTLQEAGPAFDFRGRERMAAAARSPHSIHSGGKPISQSENAGLSFGRHSPGLAVSAGDEGVGVPEATVPSVIARFAPDGRVPPTSFDTRPPVPSDRSGVGQPASCTWASRLLTTIPIEWPAALAAALRARCPSGVPPQVVADGVAQPASIAIASVGKS